MRLPDIATDYWGLVSAEARHSASPDSFPIPSLEDRTSLVVGQAAKLIFEIEADEEDGTASVSTERMWVIVSGKADEYYFGVLGNQPCTISQSSDFYLREGAEVPFLPSHIIAIATPPQEYTQSVLATQSSSKWPRGVA